MKETSSKGRCPRRKHRQGQVLPLPICPQTWSLSSSVPQGRILCTAAQEPAGAPRGRQESRREMRAIPPMHPNAAPIFHHSGPLQATPGSLPPASWGPRGSQSRCGDRSPSTACVFSSCVQLHTLSMKLEWPELPNE